MYIANNPRTTQQLGVKEAQIVMNDPHTASLSLEAMTPNPGQMMCLLVGITNMWTGAICCNREETAENRLGLAHTS